MSKKAKLDQPKKKILCTGGVTGYLASFISEAVDKYNITSNTKKIEYIPTSRQENTTFGITFRFDTPEDITNAAKTLRELKPDVIVHAAASTSPAKCELDMDATMKSNCPSGLLDAVELAEQQQEEGDDGGGGGWRLGRFIYVSTDQVYQGDAKSDGRVSLPPVKGFASTLLGKENTEQKLWPPILPNDLLPPVNVYGKSKLAFEKLLLERRGHTNASDGGGCVILRSSNMLGPVSPITGDGRFLQWLESAVSVSPDAEKINLYVDEYRNFVYVRDVARAILSVSMSSPSTTMQAVYNVGGGINLSRYELGRLVCSVKGYPFEKSNLGMEKQAGKTGVKYTSPLDIGMDSSALERDFSDFKFTPMEVTLKESLA